MKMYIPPQLELVRYELKDVILYSVPVPTHNVSELEVPILTRIKDELYGGDGLSELPTEDE